MWRRRRQRLWQFYLADLLALTVLVASGAAWVASWMHGRAAEQRLVAMTAEEDLDWIKVDWEYVGPVWWRQLLGRDLCGPWFRVRALHCWGLKDADSAALTWVGNHAHEFHWLDELGVVESAVTDDLMHRICAATELKRAYLDGTAVTDASLALLGGQQRHLTELGLDRCKITDAGLAHLLSLKDMKSLTLAGTHITSDALVYLEQLRGLEELDLTGTNVSDQGLEKLQQLTKLEVLKLNGTAISDAGVERLRELSNLQSLDLRGTAVTDRCADTLVTMPWLVIVDLRDTSVTTMAVKALNRARPLLSVNSNPPASPVE